MNLNTLIDNTDCLKNEMISTIKDLEIQNRKIIGKSGNSVPIITPCGDYKLVDVDGKLQQLSVKWNLWHNEVKSYANASHCTYTLLYEVDQCIKCGWRLHKNDIDSFIGKIEETMDGIVEILNEAKKYTQPEDNSNITAQQITMNISSPTIIININDVKSLYIRIQNVLEKIQLPENERKEIESVIREGRSNPSDIGILKKLSNILHNKVEKLSPEMEIISLFLNIFGPIIGV